jgi:putative nucleotidyltransferase with HDIG domain
MTSPSRSAAADELLRRFAAALRASQLYSKGHALITRNLAALVSAVESLHSQEASTVIGVVGDKIIVDDAPSRADGLSGLVRRLKQIGIERITIDRGVTADELQTLVDAVCTLEARPDGEPPPFPTLEHVRVGRITTGETGETGGTDMATFKRLYTEAVSIAQTLWASASTEAKPDATAARSMIDGLAHAVSQNRSALLALTTLKDYDNYTFTHMVNVSILTMGQARSIGVEGALLREFGMAALMHDIGKVRTPLEILNKADNLTDDEFVIMRRHVVDGAEILRATPDMPALAPVVAFEHHLRLDGTGYPDQAKRASLNLGTMLCSIADVYDAMRSQRSYQEAFPTDRILAVLKRNDGLQFDQHLVRRFVQLIGIYPVGNLVRLDTGEIAVVVTVYAPDPHKPQVKVVIDRSGRHLDDPYLTNLWEGDKEQGQPTSVVAPIDPATVGFDPLQLLSSG